MSERIITLGGGCFWCTEAVFVRVKGVTDVESGYCNGHVHQPSYEQVCEGNTGHVEVVQLRYDDAQLSLSQLLEVFFAVHDPTTLNRQGNDVGTQYRSAIYTNSDQQLALVQGTRAVFQSALTAADKGEITTEIAPLDTFYYAEDYHQQYLHKNPGGYCGLGDTGVTCPIGVGVSAD